ncbi:hypothetical protein SLS59_003827 [Nothophoma quercina]|uniref:Uncharacterized protein n=1 Tax=Nothophoma quercina TaxID=749835 RepID=A0ABR3RL66_9PLEO
MNEANASERAYTLTHDYLTQLVEGVEANETQEIADKRTVWYEPNNRKRSQQRDDKQKKDIINQVSFSAAAVSSDNIKRVRKTAPSLGTTRRFNTQGHNAEEEVKDDFPQLEETETAALVWLPGLERILEVAAFHKQFNNRKHKDPSEKVE